MLGPMQTILHAPTPAAHENDSTRNVMGQLRQSEIYRSYQQAYETTTGLPLALRAVGSFQSPLHESKQVNSFCALMAKNNKTCAACLQLQQRMEEEATFGTRTLQCFAGLTESAVPVRVGARVLGHLQTGQVLLQPPTKTGFRNVLRQLAKWGTGVDARRLESAYFQTRVLARRQYDSAVNLLAVFAQHLSALSNQVMVQEASAENPVIARARAYIGEHQGEGLSLQMVAQAVHVSEFHFCKLFKRVTKLTFTDYLARVRVETVKQLLLNPHKRVSEAAFEAGFQSLSQFNRVFHRITGDAPRTYRERLQSAPAGVPASRFIPQAA
jgi:AraC-like DNA-binding protein/ligand-binding sensor protein